MHIDIRTWLTEISENAKTNKKRAVLNAVRSAHNGLYFSMTSRRPFGTNAYERDWDLLVVLDACRVDAMRTVASEFDFIDSVNSIWSVGSASHEWICKTFTTDHLEKINETALISTNPHVPNVFHNRVTPPATYAIPLMWADWRTVTADDFKLIRQIDTHDREDHYATIPPDLVTDTAIKIGREEEFGRMVVHYFQPHRPYIAAAYTENRPVTDVEDQPWHAVRTGNASVEEIWSLYLDNLRFVLQSVERLLKNTDADKVILTADHGDLFGEWGQYGHPEGFAHPNLKKVPWVETSATDTQSSHPDVKPASQGENDVKERLKKLGYL